MKKIAWFASTPYQVLTAIVMKYEFFEQELVDLYIYDYFSTAEELADRVKNHCNFHLVKVCHVKPYFELLIKRRMTMVVTYIRCRRFTEKYFGYQGIYDEIYFTIPDRVSITAAKAFWGKETRAYIVEDGFSSYYHKNFKRRNILELISFCPRKLIERDTIFLYSPELFTEVGLQKKRLYIDPQNTELLVRMNHVFNYDLQYAIQEKIIYLDMLSDGFFQYDDKHHIAVINDLKEVAEENLIVKVHPRRGNAIYDCVKVYRSQGIPLEVLTMNQSFEDKILITPWSSAAFVPKLFAQQEPYVILLYKIGDKKLENSMLQFVERLKATYSKPEKILIPESLEEMKEIIKNILL